MLPSGKCSSTCTENSSISPGAGIREDVPRRRLSGFSRQPREEAVRKWRKPDHGMWEMRCEPRHFVFSKVMCWSAVDKGIALAEELKREATAREMA